MTAHDDPVLLSRLDAINEAQKRTRLALVLCTFASAAILAGLWNLYASWDIRWAEGARGRTWTEEQVQLRQINAWVDANTVGVALLGIKLSTSDAAVLGGIVLLGLAFYQCLCARRENHEVGALLVESAGEPEPLRRLIFRRISAFMVFLASESNDAPYDSLDGKRSTQTIPLFHTGWPLLIYLPAITIGATLLSDLYYAFVYVSPFDQIGHGAWLGLSQSYRWKLVAMDVSGLAMAIITWCYCRQTVIFRRGTERVVQSFGRSPTPIAPAAASAETSGVVGPP